MTDDDIPENWRDNPLEHTPPVYRDRKKPSVDPHSEYRRLAAAERARLNEPPPEGMCIGEWTALCTGKADAWDQLAEQHEQAIAEGRCWEFLYGDDKPPPP